MEQQTAQEERINDTVIIQNKGLVKINNDSNIKIKLKIDNQYYIYFPNTNVLVYVKCTLKAVNAANFQILKTVENGIVVIDCEDYIFNYEYEHFDKVHYTSFSYREKCEIYSEIDTFVISNHIYSLFNEDISYLSNIEENNEKSVIFKRKALVKINNDINIKIKLKPDEQYYMYFPDTDVLVKIKCIGKYINAADLTILQTVEKGSITTDSDNSTFSYQYEYFDTVNFSSFSYREKCEIYSYIDIYNIISF